MRRFINKIIDRIQRKRAIRNHRKMWHWLAENPTKSKFDYFRSTNKFPFNACHLCEYANSVSDRTGDIAFCQYCPLDWDGQECGKENSLFERWALEGFSKCMDVQKRTELALQIAELPEKVEK